MYLPLSQRKKQPFTGTATTSGGRSSAADSRDRDRAPVPRRRREDNRRRITLGIGLVGAIIAAWVLAMSFGTSGGGGNSSASQPQQSADTRAIEANVANLQQRLQQNPSDLGAITDLGNAYYDLGRYSEAIPWYEKAIQAAPTNTDVRTDLGTSYFYSGNLDKAKEQWFKVLEQDPNKVQTHYNLAVLYSHQTPPDMDNAVKEWQTVIKLAPDSDQAKSAQKRLQDLGKQ